MSYGNIKEFHLWCAFIFRISNGTAITWGTPAHKALASISHLSKDAAEVSWSSWMVHKDSSLKVYLLWLTFSGVFQCFFSFLCQSLFHNTTLWLRDSGILNKLYENELNAAVIIPDPRVRVNQPLNIYQLTTAFLLVAGGLTLGILAFLVECCFLCGKIKRNDVNEVCTNIFLILALCHN